MQNQPVMRIKLEFFGNHLHQLMFDRIDIFARRQSGAVGDAEDVSVDGNGCFPKCGIEHRSEERRVGKECRL